MLTDHFIRYTITVESTTTVSFSEVEFNQICLQNNNLTQQIFIRTRPSLSLLRVLRRDPLKLLIRLLSDTKKEKSLDRNKYFIGGHKIV